ncbi:hypothetical protein CONPUDRAFT_152776 [Coniophora puteana RWD-64-598 SS2]|uniref:Uncharacterized protein n=1 Tax=Coniophora puteana (strain RWD-64-598) TaxID=741705 RepID=A0A5M3MT96_CONPW|nr:uncharacterized protein CONPUDRAFT_152776 [Coniophora puteana RWD-64-598 SS2]EIW81875.1 hypothetical protein CONPUDRAFT_152776 [Coniophora puteana RWD-64-598 SS2]
MCLHNVIFNKETLIVNLAENANTGVGSFDRDFAVEFTPVEANRKITLVIRRRYQQSVFSNEDKFDRSGPSFPATVEPEWRIINAGASAMEVIAEPSLMLMRRQSDRAGLFMLAPRAVQTNLRFPQVCECLSSQLPKQTPEDVARANEYQRLYQVEAENRSSLRKEALLTLDARIKQVKIDAQTAFDDCKHRLDPGFGENLDEIATRLKVEKDLSVLSDTLIHLAKVLNTRPKPRPKPRQAKRTTTPFPTSSEPTKSTRPVASSSRPATLSQPVASSSKTALPAQPVASGSKMAAEVITPPGWTRVCKPWVSWLVDPSGRVRTLPEDGYGADNMDIISESETSGSEKESADLGADAKNRASPEV